MRATILTAAMALVMAGEQKAATPLVIFIGPPGSGKSTQAAEAAKKLGVPVVSAESLIRDNADVFAKIRRTGISGMEPQTDPVLNRLFEERMKKGDLANGFILDGYPATKDHADFLVKLAEAGRVPKGAVVFQLEIPDETVRKRSSGKGGQSAEQVEQRLKDYHREMDAVKLYYPGAEIIPIDGTKKAKSVTKKINGELKKKYGK